MSVRFAEFLKDYREKNGIGRLKLATMINCDCIVNHVISWESGMFPKKKWRDAILDYFGEEALENVIEFTWQQRIMRYMFRNDMTETVAADKMGVTQPCVARWCTTDRIPFSKTMDEILKRVPELMEDL